MIIFKSFATIFLLAFFTSCNSKRVSCEMKEGIELNQYNLRLKLTKMLALKYASEDYKNSKKGFWGIGFTDKYKKYLKMNFDDAENETGKHFEHAKETLSDDSIIIEKIIPISYDKETNKCECEATMKIPNTKIEDKFKYDITRDSQGELVGHYSYHPALKIDGDDYGYMVHTLGDVSYEKSDFEKEVQNISPANKEESWNIFWDEFKVAFRNKNKTKLASLSSDEFFSGGSGDNIEEWLSYIFNDETGYTSIASSINGGVRDHSFTDGAKSKVTGSGNMGDLYFDYKNDKWVFGGLIGD